MVWQAIKQRSASSRIGLDIGQSAIRAAQVTRTRTGWRVSTLASWHPAEGSAGVYEDAEALQKAARWLRQLNLPKRAVVAGLSPPDIELHAMQLPNLAGETARRAEAQAAHFETERLMSFGEGEVETAYWRAPESKMMASNAIGVAARRERLQQVLELCKLARLDCAQIDASSCALARFAGLMRRSEELENEVWGVLDLGSRLTRLVVCVEAVPVLARAFDGGGALWTNKVAESLSVSPESAERHKCDHGIQMLARPGSAAVATAPLSAMIFDALRADLESISAEIERSYRYVLQCFPKRRPGSLILSGGGSGMRGLDLMLAERLGIEVIEPTLERMRDHAQLDLAALGDRLREPFGNFACAIGLAIATD